MPTSWCACNCIPYSEVVGSAGGQYMFMCNLDTTHKLGTSAEMWVACSCVVHTVKFKSTLAVGGIKLCFDGYLCLQRRLDFQTARRTFL